MRRTRSSYGVAAASWAVAVLVAGCGVPTQSQAIPMTVESLGHLDTTESAPTAVPGTSTLWFVQGDQLVPVQVGGGPQSPRALLDLLASGPPEGSPNSMRSLVGDPAHGGSLVSIPPEGQAEKVPPGEVTVAVTDAFGALPADEQVLLLGQVVTTLAGAGATSVRVTDPEGVPLAVPLPDGRLLDGPATAADYASLRQ